MWGVDADGVARWVANLLAPARLTFALTPNELGVLPEHSELWNYTTGAWVPR